MDSLNPDWEVVTVSAPQPLYTANATSLTTSGGTCVVLLMGNTLS